MCVYSGTCFCCKHYWEDRSVNASECECEDITEDELDKYFSDGEKGCPHYEEDELPFYFDEEGGENDGNEKGSSI